MVKTNKINHERRTPSMINKLTRSSFHEGHDEHDEGRVKFVTFTEL